MKVTISAAIYIEAPLIKEVGKLNNPYLQKELHWRVWGHTGIWPYH